MSDEVIDKTFIELCEEADIIKCYGQPAFFLNDTLYFYAQTLYGESKQEIKINRDNQPKRCGRYHWMFGNETHTIQFFKEL
jgi:hypothetical protein